MTVILQTYFLSSMLFLFVISFGALVTRLPGKPIQEFNPLQHLSRDSIAGLTAIALIGTLGATLEISISSLFFTSGILAVVNQLLVIVRSNTLYRKEFVRNIFLFPMLGFWGFLPAVYVAAQSGAGLSMIAKGNNDVANYSAVATEFMKSGFDNSQHYANFDLNNFALKTDYRGPTSLISMFSSISQLKPWQILTPIIVFAVAFSVLSLTKFLVTLIPLLSTKKALLVSFITHHTALMMYIQSNYFLAQIIATGISLLILNYFHECYYENRYSYKKTLQILFLLLCSVYYYPHYLVPFFILSFAVFILVSLISKRPLNTIQIRDQLIFSIFSLIFMSPYLPYLFAFIERQISASTAGWPLPLISLPGMIIFPQLIGIKLGFVFHILFLITTISLLIKYSGGLIPKKMAYSSYIIVAVGVILLLFAGLIPGRNFNSYGYWKLQSSIFPVIFGICLAFLSFNNRVGSKILFLLVGVVICTPTTTWIGTAFNGMYVTKDLSSLENSIILNNLPSLNVKLQPYFETMAAGSIIVKPQIHNFSEGYWPVSIGRSANCTLIRNDDNSASYILKLNQTYGITDGSISACGANENQWNQGKELLFNENNWTSLGDGWSKPEIWGTWAEGISAKIKVPKVKISDNLNLFIKSKVYSQNEKIEQVVEVLFNNTKIGRIQYKGINNQQISKIQIPTELIDVTDLSHDLEFRIKKDIKPSSTNSVDNRNLGIGLISLQLIRS